MMSIVEQLENRRLLAAAGIDSGESSVLAQMLADTSVGLLAATDVPVMEVYGGSLYTGISNPMFPIPDGATARDPITGTDFGTAWSHPIQHGFEIRNTGNAPLVFSSPSIQVTGAHPSDFQIVRQPSPRVAEGQSSLFIVQFVPTGSGTRTATITIHSNDLATTPYTFNVFGGSGAVADIDIYENDNDRDNAKVISTQGVWKMHSLHRNDDVDWSFFELADDTDVLIQTSAPIGDLRMYLFDAAGNQVGYDNDSGAGANAALHLSLRRGLYYIRVDEYGNNASVPLYGLSVRAKPGVQASDDPIHLDGAGKLFVRGTTASDTISVDIFSGAVRVVVNDAQVFFPLGDVKSLFINGGRGNDTIYVGPGIAQADIRGSAGSDAITVDSASSATIFGGNGLDVIFGGAGDDYINGKRGNDLIYGRGGNDYIQGGVGDDYIEGGDGDDTLIGHWGNDWIDGGAGDDVIYGSVAGGEPLPAGQTDDNTLVGGAGNDTIFGGMGADDIYAGTGTNYIFAIDGRVDTIHGTEAIDLIDRDDMDEFIEDDSSVLA